MVKHTQKIRRLLPTNCLSVFEHFVGLALKGLNQTDWVLIKLIRRKMLLAKNIGIHLISACDGKQLIILIIDNSDFKNFLFRRMINVETIFTEG